MVYPLRGTCTRGEHTVPFSFSAASRPDLDPTSAVRPARHPWAHSLYRITFAPNVESRSRRLIARQPFGHFGPPPLA